MALISSIVCTALAPSIEVLVCFILVWAFDAAMVNVYLYIGCIHEWHHA